MIEMYTIVHGYYQSTNTFWLSCVIVFWFVTRENGYKLNHGSFKHDFRKYNFSNRIVNLWNSSPNFVVEADSVNAFKRSLDTFWISQDVLYVLGGRI